MSKSDNGYNRGATAAPFGVVPNHPPVAAPAE